MNAQRSHDDRIAGFRAAKLDGTSSDVSCHVARCNTSIIKGAAKDHQWTIVRVAVIEMKPHRNHVAKNGLRWLDMMNAKLKAPDVEARSVDTRSDRNGSVLMPWNAPVLGWRFVKIEEPHRAHAPFHETACDACQRDQFPDFRRDRGRTPSRTVTD